MSLVQSTTEFIGYYKTATPINSQFGPGCELNKFLILLLC